MLWKENASKERPVRLSTDHPLGSAYSAPATAAQTVYVGGEARLSRGFRVVLHLAVPEMTQRGIGRPVCLYTAALELNVRSCRKPGVQADS